MDSDKLLARVKGILLQPAREWPTIAAEAETPAGIYRRYILVLAALPPVFHFIKYSLIGHHTLGMYLRDSFVGGLWRMVLGYAIALLSVYLTAQIINALAPTFEGRKDLMQALKVTAYAWTAAWVAGIAVILPWLGWPIMLAGTVYSFYLLYLGLPQTMHCPTEKSLGYTALSALLAILLTWLLAILLGAMAGVGSMTYRLHHDTGSHARADVTAAMAKLHQIGERMQQGDKAAQAGRTSTVPTETVQALSPERMRAMLPQKLDGYTRESARASRQDVMNTQLSQAEGIYRGKDGQQIDLVILDAAGARTLLGLSGALSGDAESVTDDGFDKIRHDGDRIIHETWNSKDQRGEYTVLLANRYSVRASGGVKDFDDLKDAVHAVDLDALEKLKDAGVTRP